MTHKKKGVVPQLRRDAEKIKKTLEKSRYAVVESSSSKRTRKKVERVLIPLAVLTMLGNGLSNIGEALNGNVAAGMIALQSILLSFFVALVEYDRSEYRRKSKFHNGGLVAGQGVISHGLTVGLVGERRARKLITKPAEFSKVLILAAVESLAFGWSGLVSTVVVGLRTAFLLR